MSYQQAENKQSQRPLMKQSFIKEDQSSLPIRILKKIDIFSFIPVPKDDSVSTKQSLIGTAVFFVIFLAYISYDFYQFVAENPPNAQNYYTNSLDQNHTLPKFAVTFMSGNKLQNCGSWEQYIHYSLSQESKDKKLEVKDVLEFYVNNFTKENQGNLNKDSVDWIDYKTKQFYNILRTSSEQLKAKGLLYSTPNATYGKIKIQMCNQTDPSQNCSSRQQIKKFCAGGRVFLFIQNMYDTTSFGRQDQTNSPSFFIYNFFLEPYVYKRVTFFFQVVNTQVLPDYFFRFRKQTLQRLQIGSYIEQSSDVTAIVRQKNEQPLDMLGIQFQLSPQILNVKVTYRTLLDHVSMWGAFWGVLFALFALMFLTYNRNKFYKKNPEWDKFKQNGMTINQGEVIFSQQKRR